MAKLSFKPKILSVYLWLFFILLVFLTFSGKSYAFFSNSEGIEQNIFQAGVLDFNLQTDNDFNQEVLPDQNSEKVIQVVNWANPFKYNISTESATGDLCSYLNIRAYHNGELICSGPLLAFACDNLSFEKDDLNPYEWKFVVNLTSQDAPQDSQCQFNFLFSAHQINLPIGGFHDEEVISNVINSGNWQNPSSKILITKLYYDVDDEHGSEISNEWIELYNPGDEAIDISNWIIEDNNSQDVLPSSLTISAREFILIGASDDTWTYWENIPSGVRRIILSDGSIGDGLDNDGDRIVLRDKNGNQIDSVSYENDDSIFNPAPPLNSSGATYDLPEGHLLARVPFDLDTDTASDWKDLGLPNVSVDSPSGGTWYCNQLVNIQWTATNPNGSNNDLSITIQYIRDLNNDGEISPQDPVDTIAQNIPNTGSYTWQVSPCYYGYVWIRITAQGKENFMIHSSDLSGRVFEPPDQEDKDSSESVSTDKTAQNGDQNNNGNNLELSQDEENPQTASQDTDNSNESDQTEEDKNNEEKSSQENPQDESNQKETENQSENQEEVNQQDEENQDEAENRDLSSQEASEQNNYDSQESNELENEENSENNTQNSSNQQESEQETNQSLDDQNTEESSNSENNSVNPNNNSTQENSNLSVQDNGV